MTVACRGVWRQVSLLSCLLVVPQLKPRLAVMLMETFQRLSRKEKYVWDVRIFTTHEICENGQ